MDDLKINKDTTIGEIFPNLGDDEGVVVFRFKDKFLPTILHYYYAMCSSEGSSEEQKVWITQKRQEIVNWQENNSDKVKVPD